MTTRELAQGHHHHHIQETVITVPLKLRHATATRPVATVWLCAIVLFALSFQGLLYVVGASIGLGFISLVTLIVSTRQEMHRAHLQMSQKCDNMVARVEQLSSALKEAGIPIPDDPNEY